MTQTSVRAKGDLMATEHSSGHSDPSWFVAPGQADHQAWVSFGLLCLALYGLLTLYAAFDRWAEHKAEGTPLAKTIPTMLTIALLYEIFPLGHFNILLPLAAILISLMADWSRFHLRNNVHSEVAVVVGEQPAGAQSNSGSSGEIKQESKDD